MGLRGCVPLRFRRDLASFCLGASAVDGPKGLHASGYGGCKVGGALPSHSVDGCDEALAQVCSLKNTLPPLATVPRWAPWPPAEAPGHVVLPSDRA